MLPYISVFGHVIPLYGVMIVAGVLASIVYIKVCKKRRTFPEADTELALIYSVIGCFLGAKLLWLLTVWPEFTAELSYLFTNTAAFLQKYMYGGFVFYGGLIGGLVAAWIYCRVNKLSYYSLAQSLMPVIPLFHAFGRIGCFLMGCCYGCPSNTFGISYTLSEIAPNGIPLLPVQLIEAVVEFILFAVLAWMAERNVSGKTMVCTWLISYGITRFALEYFRGDDYRGFLGTLSVSQVISLVLIGYCAILLLLEPIKNRFHRKVS